MFAAVVAAVAAEVYFEDRFEDGGTSNTDILDHKAITLSSSDKGNFGQSAEMAYMSNGQHGKLFNLI